LNICHYFVNSPIQQNCSGSDQGSLGCDRHLICLTLSLAELLGYINKNVEPYSSQLTGTSDYKIQRLSNSIKLALIPYPLNDHGNEPHGYAPHDGDGDRDHDDGGVMPAPPPVGD
jgi:hypothetical protein